MSTWVVNRLNTCSGWFGWRSYVRAERKKWLLLHQGYLMVKEDKFCVGKDKRELAGAV